MRVGEILVALGKASQADVDAALDEQRRHHRRLGEILVSRGIVSEVDLAETLAREFQLPYVDLAKFPVDPRALALVPASVILKHHVDAVRLSAGHPAKAIAGDTDLRQVLAVCSR
jgi:hypothetical protein